MDSTGVEEVNEVKLSINEGKLTGDIAEGVLIFVLALVQPVPGG